MCNSSFELAHRRPGGHGSGSPVDINTAKKLEFADGRTRGFSEPFPHKMFPLGSVFHQLRFQILMWKKI